MDIYMVFINFKQTYDCVYFTKLFKAMIHFGIPNEIIQLVKLTTCKVKIQEDLTESFAMKKGLKQGDGLVNIDTKGTIVYKSSQLLAYADDILIISRSMAAINKYS